MSISWSVFLLLMHLITCDDAIIGLLEVHLCNVSLLPCFWSIPSLALMPYCSWCWCVSPRNCCHDLCLHVYYVYIYQLNFRFVAVQKCEARLFEEHLEGYKLEIRKRSVRWRDCLMCPSCSLTSFPVCKLSLYHCIKINEGLSLDISLPFINL